MIFNEMNIAASTEVVTESPYELGIGGALMHVYENECNYNALMKAAALSEMKYFNQTGGDLFVQEAGAFVGFLKKVKAFFLKVIEKIKSIAHKFMAKINQFVLKDKDFVKKYEVELKKRDLKDFEFNGYAFPDWEGNIGTTNLVSKVKEDGSDDTDALNDIKEANRGGIVGGSAMTESEYRDELKEKLYGDKDDIKVDIRAELNTISTTKSLVTAAEKAKKASIDAIEKIIKDLEKDIKEQDKAIDAGLKANTLSDADKTTKVNHVKCLNNKVDVYRAFSNDVTVYFGAKVKALNDKNRQAKAICVKALSYKATNESAAVAEGAYDNIFSGVEIL